jgi:hypothetical protein
LRLKVKGDLDQGGGVIELMPAAVRTERTADLPKDGDFKMITAEQRVTETFKGWRAGREEIRPGQANRLGRVGLGWWKLPATL